MSHLQDLITDARDLAKRGGGSSDLATTAVALARHIRDAQDALDPLKSILRDIARSERTEDQHHVGYEVPEGRVSVTFPQSRYQARRDVNWDEARTELGKEFATFFHEKVVVTSHRDIETLLRDAENADRVLQFVQKDEPTPRVGFKPA